MARGLALASLVILVAGCGTSTLVTPGTGGPEGFGPFPDAPPYSDGTASNREASPFPDFGVPVDSGVTPIDGSSGGCSGTCPAPSRCIGGKCTCGAGGAACPPPSSGTKQVLMCCGADCVDLCSDGNNCGSCGNACLFTCSQGGCDFFGCPLPSCL